MKIYKGIIKKVPSDEHFKDYEQGKLELSELSLVDTIKKIEYDNGVFEVLPIRLSYQEVDGNGNEKFIFDDDSDVYVKSYKQTPILEATGKELRILIELGEYSPVKVVVSEHEKNDSIYYNIECIQNQHCGLE